MEEMEKDPMDRMMALTAIYRPVPMEPLTEALLEQAVMTERPTSMDL